MTSSARLFAVLVALAAAGMPAGTGAQTAAQGNAQAAAPAARTMVREYEEEFVTYPFSDPNPIPVVGRIYPYFRFDGFTNVPVKHRWKVVELENRWIRIAILPEIGGKIWRAIDKASGKSFIYDNHVVKFRDIAMRGPWTSGGIEANYGIIGHTPNVATPVDYTTSHVSDSSASCIIGAFDMLTRTSWRLTINLPVDKAYFTTSSFWFNNTPFEQPYYSWMNAAIPVGNDLEFIYAGNHFLGHGGEVGDWPVNRANGKVVSWYRNNDFDGYKSYHVSGSYTEFFGAFWHAQNFGMARYAPHDEKAGKKLWIWGLSRQGMIWEQLLTDADGQYTEVQSGRLFNQTAEASTLTPFKHRGFAPYSADLWTEYWFPVKGTDGFVLANAWGALNVQSQAGGLVLSLSPVQRIADTLEVFDGDRRIYARLLRLEPLALWRDTLVVKSNATHLRVTLGGHKMQWTGDTAVTRLDRPTVSPADFNWSSAYGHFVSGKEKLRERDYLGAELELRAALGLDSGFVPALSELASLRLRHGDGAGALALARRALSIDTYDPAANFVYAQANLRAGRRIDARDGFDIAAQSPEYRGGAWTELARMSVQDGDLNRAIELTEKAVYANWYNIEAWRVRTVAQRLLRATGVAVRSDSRELGFDALSHFALFEQGLDRGSDTSHTALRQVLTNEMPTESLLELALWYADLGQLATADRVLAMAAPHPEVLYWRAYLHERLGLTDVTALLARAGAASPQFVFPWRVESVDVMTWAASKSASWMPRYFLGLLRWHLGDSIAARSQLVGLGNTPEFAPFYAARAELLKTSAPGPSLADLTRAAQLDPGEWRYGRLLAERALAGGNLADGVRLAAESHQRFPGNSALAMLYARALLRNGEDATARKLLDRLVVLPYEGAGEAHALYREANLLSAVRLMRARNKNAALKLIAKARLWPERLGAGRPYDQDVDERLEVLLESWSRAGGASRPGVEDQLRALQRSTPDPVVQRVVSALTASAGR